MATGYGGVYRGTVMNNIDPAAQGRVQVSVPSVGGLAAAWAPMALPSLANDSLVRPPPIGRGVWVMFEGGSTDAPVVIGLMAR
jgi:phage baseplate assembly protein gpV